jgi:hypothetical protein
MAAAFFARSATQVCRWFENTYRSSAFVAFARRSRISWTVEVSGELQR